MNGVDDGVGGGVVVHVGGVDDVVAVWWVFKRQQRVLLHKNDRQCQGFGKVVGKELAGEGGGGPETRSAGPREGDTRRRRTSLGAPDSST